MKHETGLRTNAELRRRRSSAGDQWGARHRPETTVEGDMRRTVAGNPITARRAWKVGKQPWNTDTVDSVVLSDQVKSLDWKARRIEFIEKIGLDIFAEVKSKVMLLMD